MLYLIETSTLGIVEVDSLNILSKLAAELFFISVKGKEENQVLCLFRQHDVSEL